MLIITRSFFITLYFLLLITSPAVFAQTKPVKDTTRRVDSIRTHTLQEIVISASRTAESILKSPVSIENVNSKYFKSSGSPSFFDALENVKGVQMLTPSLGFKIINTRGFANTTNVRFTQLVDGIDNQAPHIGAPIGNAMGPGDLDIERVEIIPGTTSALYGLNAVNGLANFITKDPFTSAGVTVQQRTGINHLGDNNSKAKPFSETGFRIAEKLSERFAIKINATYTKGYDWIADNRTDLNAGANTSVGIAGGVNNPGYDPVNGYGNESSDRRTITMQGRRYVVARTGYAEKDVTDYNIQNIKADLGLYYKLSPKTTLSYTYRFADLDNVYQRANRFALKDYILQQHAVEVKNDIFQARAFLTSENTGKSYNLRSAAENQDRHFKSDDNWYADYTNAFNSAIGVTGTSTVQALNQARLAADRGRLQPGTAAFKNTLNELADVNNWDVGSALRVKDDLVHGEAQVDLAKAIGNRFKQQTGLELLAGADYQSYIIQPDGNYFINPAQGKTFETFTYGKTGGLVQAGKNLFHDLLKLTATLRADKNDYFDTKFNPRFTAVVTPDDHQSIRMSYQSGSRFPSIFEAFSNVNSGGVRRVGGLKVMSDGVFENAYLRSSIDRFQAAVTNDFNNNGLSTAAAIEKEKGLLVKNHYSYLQPEHINSFELGYKGLFLARTLKVDADFYYNKYNNFIAQVEMNVPGTTKPDSIPYYLNNRSQQSRYRIYTNSRSVVYNYGGSLGLSYLLLNHYTLGGNVSYAKLSRTDNNDGFEDGFNTPEWIMNFSVGGEHVVKSLSFNVTYKHQCGFYWQSFLVNGNVKAYGNIDAQANYDFYNDHLNIKIGATNLLNHYYYSFLGGPSIGGLYYTTLTYRL
ncbi:TonB-dependent receptor [Mucilaginibacter sp. KACC 22773]|uniref:TonB-dependent receptor n=1 Tax=Mucilaginibacter sp. KACC 22773 TaxID=3025671 RepID=UPI0023672288|nr:TonB-dependent receptor [Mucilaginibacter sp. KACC 22773]WDF77208.1 TonB-dependent receptor [Mucilaginibacter sp. KACC 22773]